MKSFKQLGLLSVSAALLLSMAACGSGNTASQAKTPDKTSQSSGTGAAPSDNKQASGDDNQKPLDLNIMTVFYDPTPPPKDNPVIAEIEKYTNSKINMIWVPGSTYDEKFNITLSSGSLPTAILAIDTKSPTVINASRSGLFWDIGPYLKDFPNLSKGLDPQIMDTLKVDGKLYSIYRWRPVGRDGFLYREDWMNALNLKVPTNLDEVYAMAKAFAKNDPDHNGKDDTIGFEMNKDLGALVDLTTLAGGPNGWQVADGKFIPVFETKPFQRVIDLLQKMYGEGLINKDFAAINSTQSTTNLEAGKVGLMLKSMSNTGIEVNAKLQKVVPDGKFDVFARLPNEPGGPIGSTGFLGAYMFPKSSVKTEADLKRVLGFFDKLMDTKMVDLLQYGIEGKHFHYENKEVVIDKSAKDDLGSVGQLGFYNQGRSLIKDMNPVDAKAWKLGFELADVAVHNPADVYVSNTYTKRGNELDQIIVDAETKYIMGASSKAEFDAQIQKWHKNGGDQIIQEYEAAYKDSHSK